MGVFKQQSMKRKIKDYLSTYFELPIHFIIPEARLNILSILSLYFDDHFSMERSIELEDIDPEKLSIDINEHEIKREGNKLMINLRKLMKDPPSDDPTYTDIVGRDGFCEFHFHYILAIMELPEKVNKKPLDESKLDDPITVEDLFKACDRTANFSKN